MGVCVWWIFTLLHCDCLFKLYILWHLNSKFLWVHLKPVKISAKRAHTREWLLVSKSYMFHHPVCVGDKFPSFLGHKVEQTFRQDRTDYSIQVSFDGILSVIGPIYNREIVANFGLNSIKRQWRWIPSGGNLHKNGRNDRNGDSVLGSGVWWERGEINWKRNFFFGILQQMYKRLTFDLLIEDFANTTTLTTFTYLTYLSTLYFNLGEIIRCVWDTIVF